MFDRRNIAWPLEAVVRPVLDIDPKVLENFVGELTADHAQFMSVYDRDSAAFLVGGCDESQLEKNLILLRGKILGAVDVDPPQVGFRETIRKAAEVDYSHQKRVGDAGQFARVRILVEPLEAGAGFKFENKAAGNAVPTKFIQGVESGIQSMLGSGVVAGFPMIDLNVSLVDGDHHDVDSSVMAFEIASREAFREGIQKAAPVLLWPILKVEVVTPTEYSGDITGDLQSRRGNISGRKSEDGTLRINAFVPTGLMFGFSNTLASLTQRRASFSVLFSHYEAVPSPSDDLPPRKSATAQ